MTPMKGSNKWQRDMQRVIHLMSGILIVLYVYSPAGDAPTFILLMQVVVMPVLVLSGMLMWQLPRLRKLLQGRSNSGGNARGAAPVGDRPTSVR